METFNFIVSSADNYENGAIVANHCVVVNTRFYGLPPNVRYFKCKVKSFFINPASFLTGSTDGRYVSLMSPNFVYSNMLIFLYLKT
jgi:hypothetical protein